MVPRTPRRQIVAIGAGGLALSLALAGCSAGGDSGSSDGAVSLTYLVDNQEATVATAEALVDAFKAENPDITVKLETQPGGTEGDNLMKTKLATGEMDDVFHYNSGSLLPGAQPRPDPRRPDRRGVGRATSTDDFKTVVAPTTGLYGAPWGTVAWPAPSCTTRTVYADLGLEVPTTWDEFIANNEKIKAAGNGRPDLQSYGDTWTSPAVRARRLRQRARRRTPTGPSSTPNNKAKYVDEPALAGLRAPAGGVREAGCSTRTSPRRPTPTAMDGSPPATGAQYPMLTGAIASVQQNNPDAVDDIGFFALPGPDADDTAMTMWHAERASTSRRRPRATSSTRPRSSWRSSTRPRAATSRTTTGSRRGPVRDRAPARCPTTCPRWSTTCSRTSTTARPSPALEFLSPDQGPEPREDHGRGRLRHHRPPRTAPRSTTRTSRSRPSSSVCRAGERRDRSAEIAIQGPAAAVRRPAPHRPHRWRSMMTTTVDGHRRRLRPPREPTASRQARGA